MTIIDLREPKPLTRWWEGLEPTNGVFKGGGAKGIAFAGALDAYRNTGRWFANVAGASAGAITATLIAAGLRPEDMAEKVPEALRTLRQPIRSRAVRIITGWANSRYDSGELCDWLRRTLREQLGGQSDAPVTFGELYSATHIGLYVVTMDLATGAPIVFSHRTTPTVEVAPAVTASSAIPMAFPAGRVVLAEPDGNAVVHQLIDGGAFANYPRFVFTDRSFRCKVLGIDPTRPDDETDLPTVGFVLDEAPPTESRQPVGFVSDGSPSVNRRFDQGPTYTSKQASVFASSALFSSDWSRLFVGAALITWMVLSIYSFPVSLRAMSTWLDHVLPTWLYPVPVILLSALLILAAAGATVTLLGLVLCGRIFGETALPAAKVAMGVATETVPWAGGAPDDAVVYVPYGSLDTTTFGATEQSRDAAIKVARCEVAKQLSDPVFVAKLGGTAAPGTSPAYSRVADRPLAPEKQRRERPIVMGLVVALLAAILTSLAGWALVDRILIRSYLWQSALLVVAVIATAALALAYFASRTAARAHARSLAGVPSSATRPARRIGLLALVGVAAMAGGIVLSAFAIHGRNQEVTPGRVVGATSDFLASENSCSTSYQYEVVKSGAVTKVCSDEKLRLGDRIFVDVHNNDVRSSLSANGKSALYVVSVALVIVGFGVITSAVRYRSWHRRCAALDTRRQQFNTLVGDRIPQQEPRPNLANS